MYCQKCGYRMPEGAAFCEKCGTRVIVDDNTTQQAVLPDQQQSQQAQPQAARSKKSRKRTGGIIFGLIVVVIIMIGNLDTDSSSYDYIASVQAMRPVAQSSATYEDLLENYLESPKWKERKGDNGIVYVDISGTPHDSDQEIVLTIRVDPTDDPEVLWFTPHRIMIDGRGSDEIDAASFVNELYLAYEYGSGLVDLMKFLQLFS